MSNNLPPDPGHGVKVFSIGGRMIEERERCMGMTDQERRWRAQFLKDQIVSHEEPRFVPEYYKDVNNIFRRLWKTPMMKLEKILVRSMGPTLGVHLRHYIGKTSFMIACLYLGCYYAKYVANDWTYSGGMEWATSRSIMYPDDPNYPNYYQKTAQDYADMGFYSSVLCKKVEKPPEVPKAVKKVVDAEVVCPPPEK